LPNLAVETLDNSDENHIPLLIQDSFSIHMLKSFDIYSQNNILKIIVAINLMLVGTASLFYTQRIIERLEAREQQYVLLYAKAIQNAIQSDINEFRCGRNLRY
jgi:hypothetical protein